MRRALAAISLCVIVAISFPAHAVRALPASRVPAPNFTCDKWLNSRPLTIADLRGKVVLVDFWEYTCINCIRTFPYLRRWNELYAPLGLVIIGVHTPEFDFAKNPELVKNAAKRFGLDFPIAVDSDRRVWAAFDNEAWPADYLIDRDGNVAFAHEGEGDYANMERRIQALLKEANPKLDFAGAKFAIPPDDSDSGRVCLRPTPELYLGYLRGDRIANARGYNLSAGKSYSAPQDTPLDEYSLEGPWMATPEFVRRGAPESDHQTSELKLHYRAKAVYIVAGSDEDGGAVQVEQDGKPLEENSRGVDIRQDRSGETYMPLGRKRMYYVVNNPDFGEHTIALSTKSPAVALYSFTFGNNCETRFDHR